ncbi:bifunctional nicotinamidase/pyrazinamidase [Aquella oligotrophica]|uniref:nicotinamidase n=1 Tax=Aquella oligotrophica TaxID=2067065 RepID=A0A2I7N4A5_9NEIS|nr:bifunctional nicotinamidase/pyrazinamidase [Aquella oligotrophica]AUR51296.1 nicotinamidase/pyrazinamidase [Aquella oligotrophica]
MKKALLVVDIQNDFCSGGALAIPYANDIIRPINQLMQSADYDLIVATQDWHPENHSSFIINSKNGIWPVHCVQNTYGAEFHSAFNLDRIDRVIRKGANPKVDSYSAFYDNDKISKTELEDYLVENGISCVEIAGLALDYCVKYSAEDSLSLGFNTSVLVDYCRAVNNSDSLLASFNKQIQLKFLREGK